MVKKITKWGIKYSSKQENGWYYKSGEKKEMLKEISKLRTDIPSAKWRLIKYKDNAWIPKI